MSMEQFQHISVQQTHDKMQQSKVSIVDIRDEQSFASGHITGSIHLTNGTLNQFMQDNDMDEPVVVCCYHGISSQQAAQFLIHQGFEEVYSLDGGFEAWRAAFPDDISKDE